MLTDVVMPGMSGAQLVREVRRRYPGLKAIFMSGYSPDARELEGVADDEFELLEKPFTMQDLTLRVREVLAGPPLGA
jgi:DNA-binding NtrC family response regulator